jgi:hypothetical protein
LRFRASKAGYFKGFIVAALTLCAPALAASPEAEIEHLLGFIAASPCGFIRNGVAYDGAQAMAHIEDKYDYYRDDIRSAEDFIALAATRSALSGKPYLVTCGGTTEPAADWIARELGAYRRNSGS